MEKTSSNGGGYFVNNTGKTIQQLLDEARAKTPAGYRSTLMTCIVYE